MGRPRPPIGAARSCHSHPGCRAVLEALAGLPTRLPACRVLGWGLAARPRPGAGQACRNTRCNNLESPPSAGTVSSPRLPALPCAGQASTLDKDQVTGTLMGVESSLGGRAAHPRHCRCPGLPARCQRRYRGTATEMRVLEGAQPRHEHRCAPHATSIWPAMTSSWAPGLAPWGPIALRRV